MKLESMEINLVASNIMREAIERCRQIYPKDTRLVILFEARRHSVCCKVHSCLGSLYHVEIESSGEMRMFYPEIHPHRLRSEQQEMFKANN